MHELLAVIADRRDIYEACRIPPGYLRDLGVHGRNCLGEPGFRQRPYVSPEFIRKLHLHHRCCCRYLKTRASAEFRDSDDVPRLLISDQTIVRA